MSGYSQHLLDWWNGLLHPARAAALITRDQDSGLFRRLIVAIALLYAFYGFSMGLFRGLYPACISSLKLSFLYFFTLAICLPSLYVLNCLIGPRLQFLACLRLLVLALSVNAVGLGSYAFFSLFFTLTSGYSFLVLMHVGVFGLAGIFSLVETGIVFRAVAHHFGRPLRSHFLLAWAIIYAFVGTQVSWVLRPWIGSWSMPYTPFRSIEGSFVEALYRLLF